MSTRARSLPAIGQVAGTKQLKVVSRCVAGERQVLLLLPEDLVDDGGWDAVHAEPADGQVVAVADVPAHGLGTDMRLSASARGWAAKASRAASGSGSVKRRPVGDGRGSLMNDQ